MIRVTPVNQWVVDYGIAAGHVFDPGFTTLNIPSVVPKGECIFDTNVIFDSDDASAAGALIPSTQVYRQISEVGPLQYHVIIGMYNPAETPVTMTKAFVLRLFITQISATTGFFSPNSD